MTRRRPSSSSSPDPEPVAMIPPPGPRQYGQCGACLGRIVLVVAAVEAARRVVASAQRTDPDTMRVDADDLLWLEAKLREAHDDQ